MTTLEWVQNRKIIAIVRGLAPEYMLSHGNTFVGVMDQTALFLGHGHAAEAVHMLADGAVVTAVAARQHQIGRDQHAGIGGADGALQPVPGLVAGLGNGAGFAD